MSIVLVLVCTKWFDPAIQTGLFFLIFSDQRGNCEIMTVRNKTEWKQQNEYMYVQLLSIKKTVIIKEDHFYNKYI